MVKLRDIFQLLYPYGVFRAGKAVYLTFDDGPIPNGTAFISDVGMCGEYDSVLGFETKSVINKTIYGYDSKFQLSDEGIGLFSAVVIDIDEISGKAKSIFPIYYVEEENR